MPLNIHSIQSALQANQLDGWLLYDFRGLNPLAVRIARLPADGHYSRRWFYYIPARGTPTKLVHGIEAGSLDHLPGQKFVYARWQSLETLLQQLLNGAKTIAMEYSPGNANPYISYVDAGTAELVRSFGVAIATSGDLIQEFEATLSDEQMESHLAAARQTDAAFRIAWDFVADQIARQGGVEETAVRDRILQHFESAGLITNHSPIVAVGANGGNPHYETGTGKKTLIGPEDFVLIDLWAREDNPNGVYSDLTRVAFVGENIPEPIAKVFGVVATARDTAINLVRAAFRNGDAIAGWQIDVAARDVIEASGHGEAFVHRTGHSIGPELHGNGTHIDNFETRDERRILPRTLFSIEPGIYLPEFGIRSEVNVLIDAQGGVRVTGGEPQQEVQRILLHPTRPLTETSDGADSVRY